jgi:hypothetical protein
VSPMVKCPEGNGCCEPCTPMFSLAGSSVGDSNTKYEVCGDGDCGTKTLTCKRIPSESSDGAVSVSKGAWVTDGKCNYLN